MRAKGTRDVKGVDRKGEEHKLLPFFSPVIIRLSLCLNRYSVRTGTPFCPALSSA